MRSLIFAACCALLPPVAAQAQSFQSVNRLTVVPLNNADFEVIEARGEGPRGIWCAAADFVDTTKRGGRVNRIYVKSALGPSVSGAGRKGVVFTTNSGEVDPSTSYSLSVRQPGLGLPVDHAIQFCKDYLYDLSDTISYRRIQP